MTEAPARSRLRRRLLWAMGGMAAFGALAIAVFFVIFYSISPAPMSRFEDRATAILARDGQLLRAYLSSDEKWRFRTQVEDVDPLYLDLLIAFEDKRFYDHNGFDPLAMARAGLQALTSGRVVSGASTLTMQTARLLDPAPRTLSSKVVEIRRALDLERRFGKQGVLEIYLTLAPFGGNLEGVSAASWAWFGKPPAELTPGEAALLAATPKNPNAYRPDLRPDRARRARARVLAAGVARGVLTPEEAEAADAEPLPERRRDFPMHAPHAGDLMRAQAPEDEAIHTTLDFTLQQRVETVMHRAALEADPRASAAALVVHTPTNEVLARVGAAEFFDHSRNGMVDMVQADRSPGSALKPFIYGLAFERAIAHPLTVIDDRAADYSGYAPRNFEREFTGEVAIADALSQSLNTPAVAVLDRLGARVFAAALSNVGAPMTLPEGGAPGLAMALGGGGMQADGLARLYHALTDGRVPSALRLRLDDPEPESAAIFGPVAAYHLRDSLILPPPPGASNEAAGGYPRPALKTGTSWGRRDAWAAALYGEYVIVTWLGRPDGAPCPGCTGLAVAAPAAQQITRMLPPPIWPEKPAGVVEHVEDLSPSLRRFRPAGAPLDFGRSRARSVEIDFPMDGARLDLAEGEEAPLSARGGRRPLRWLVNGRLVATSRSGRMARWTPDSGGFHRVQVIDAAGQTAAASIYVERPSGR